MEENKELDRYQETKRRMFVKYTNAYMSDKEIIEYLAEEIEQYRNRIDNQKRIIDYLSKNKESNTIIKDKLISNEQDYKKDNEDILDDDIEEIITTSQMADGKIIKIITEYKYKEN